ncbi:MAG: PTS sugar transporter subunit IIB [bacterium]|nr:PTS sugar transporter subunit IIB [bacterium]
MPIVLVRIDERLIHGQVIVGWVKFLKATAIIVVDDEIEKDKLRLEAMKLAVPEHIKVEAYSVALAVEKYLHHDLPDRNVIILFSRLKDFKRSLDLGFTTREVNVGCVHSGEIKILSNIAIKAEEAYYLVEIQKSGIHLDLRALPGDKRIELQDIPIYRKLIGQK